MIKNELNNYYSDVGNLDHQRLVSIEKCHIKIFQLLIFKNRDHMSEIGTK